MGCEQLWLTGEGPELHPLTRQQKQRKGRVWVRVADRATWPHCIYLHAYPPGGSGFDSRPTSKAERHDPPLGPQEDPSVQRAAKGIPPAHTQKE